MNELETLKAVRDLLSDPKRWTQGAFARHESGAPIGPRERGASCWCLRGAVIKVDPTSGGDGPIMAIGAAMHELQGIGSRPFNDLASIARFNDAPVRRHHEIMKVIDLAIKNEEAKSHDQ